MSQELTSQGIKRNKICWKFSNGLNYLFTITMESSGIFIRFEMANLMHKWKEGRPGRSDKLGKCTEAERRHQVIIKQFIISMIHGASKHWSYILIDFSMIETIKEVTLKLTSGCLKGGGNKNYWRCKIDGHTYNEFRCLRKGKRLHTLDNCISTKPSCRRGAKVAPRCRVTGRWQLSAMSSQEVIAEWFSALILTSRLTLKMSEKESKSTTHKIQ